MIEGQKVVCIDDVFPDWAKAMYNELPEKDKKYTIRKVVMGVAPIGVTKESKGSTPVFIGQHEVTLLLNELNNPIHPNSKQEMGFLSIRFQPLDEFEILEKEEVYGYVKIKEPVLV